MFCRDYPRGFVNCFSILRFPASDPLPVALALTVASLLALLRRPVPSLRLPPRPSPRGLPAALAAIALACLPGMKALLASFEQTAPHARPACQSLPPASRLIFGMDCRILGRAMGGDDSQKLLPWRGRSPLRGANLRLNYESTR